MLDFKTSRTVIGYCRSMLEKQMGFSFKRSSVPAIYNFHQTDIGLKTSGQPTEKQFDAIKGDGVKIVVNLAPSSAENSLNDERELVERLGMAYVHIPVDFSRPTYNDFEKFVDIVEHHAYSDLWVHCAANMRVSAFVYRYRVFVLNHKRIDAIKDLNEIWKPFGVWKQFLDL